MIVIIIIIIIIIVVPVVIISVIIINPLGGWLDVLVGTGTPSSGPGSPTLSTV